MPVLDLTPSSLGKTLALQQRLTVRFSGGQQTLDALLEVDPGGLRLVVQALGQQALRLDWDGHVLRQLRAPWLPASLTGERVLFDMQLVYWPVQSLRAALPPAWSLLETGDIRRLQHDGKDVAVVHLIAGDSAALDHPADGYHLDIQSTQATETPP